MLQTPILIAEFAGILVMIVGLVLGVAYVLESELWMRRKKDRVVYYASNIGLAGPVVIDIIKKYIGEDVSEYALVEPGAGLGHMARFLAKRLVWKEVQATDIGPVILFLGRILNRLKRTQKDIDFIKADVFTYDMPKQAFVYCYLSSPILSKMHALDRFDDRLVVTLTFPIEGVEPTETIELPTWQSPIRVYDFRKKATR